MAWSSPASIVLRLSHPAAACHRDDVERNPAALDCAFVVAPKVAKFRRQFTARLKRRADEARDRS
jgi:hypothetical protein